MIRVAATKERRLVSIPSEYKIKCKRFLTEPCLITELKSITKSEVVKLLGRVLVQSSRDVKTKGLITCLLLSKF